MSSKVVHIPDEIHNAAKRYCTANNLSMSQWVANLIVAAVPELRPRRQPSTASPVGKRAPAAAEPPKDIEAVVSSPPFWENR